MIHDSDAIGDGQRFFLVMGNVNRGDPQPALKLFDDGTHLHTKLGIQVGQRLVHQQHTRFDDEGAGQGNSLLLTAGKLAGLTLGQRKNLHQVKCFLDTLFNLRLFDTACFQTIGYVFFDRQVRENGVVLEDHADVALMGRNVVDDLVAKEKLAAFYGIEACNHSQQRCFAAAGRAQESKEFPFLDMKGHIAQGGKIAVALDCIFDDDFVAHM